MRDRIRNRLLDKMIAAYVEWRLASRVVNDAYHSWASSTGAGARAEFMRYSAALDTEEFAADAYARLVRQVARVVQSDRGLRSQA